MPWRGGEGGYGSQYGPTSGGNSVDYTYATDVTGTFYPTDPETSPTGRTQGDIESQGAEFVFTEDFERGTDTAALVACGTAGANTAFTIAFTAPVFTSAALYGTLSTRFNPGAATISYLSFTGITVESTLFLRGIFSLENGWPVGGNVILMTVRGNGNATVRAQLQLETTGQITLNNVAVGVFTSVGSIPTSGPIRIEWMIDSASGQQVQAWWGANLAGVTPDLDSGVQTYTAATMDTLRIGLPSNATTSPISILLDEVMARTDTWCGPPTSATVVTWSSAVDATAAMTAAVAGPFVNATGTLAASATMSCSVAGTDTIPATLSASATTSTSVSGTETHSGTLSASAVTTAAATGPLVTLVGVLAATAALTATVTGTVVTLTTPANLTVTALTGTSLRISWDLVTLATDYQVERDSVTVATGVTAITYDDTGLTPATTYSYRVRARQAL